MEADPFKLFPFPVLPGHSWKVTPSPADATAVSASASY